MDGKILYTYFDILTLRAPESALVKAVPRPKGAFIKKGLPTWNIRPLENKLPLLPGPDGPIVFSRGKLGKTLWKSSPGTDFMLFDPYGYEVSIDYEPLHDKHLKQWLKQSKNREYLLKHGLVTEEMDVKCSVKQCNEYRKYLKRIHSSAIAKEAIRREDERFEQVQFTKANEMLNKEISKLSKKEDTKGRRKENIEIIKQAAELKKQDCDRRLKRIFERAAYIEQKKKSDLKKSIERRRAKDDFIQNKIKAANKIERNRKIQTLRRWHDTDIQKKRKHDQECLQKQKEHAEKAKERWMKKVENQIKELEKEEFVRKQRSAQLEASRKLRMKKITIRQACLQEKILLQQGQPIVKHVTKNFKTKQKKILNTIQNNWLNVAATQYSNDPVTLKLLQDKIKDTLADVRFDFEPYMLVTEAKRRLQSDLDVPEPVTDVLKYCMEEAIMISVAKSLEKTMFKIAHNTLTALDKLQFPFVDKTKTPSVKPKTLYSDNLELYKDEKEARVSFGVMVQFSRDDEDLLDLKSAKTRRPTPVPSAEVITMVALGDPEIEPPSVPVIFVEQKKLMDNIDNLCVYLLKHVERRVQSLAETKSQFSAESPSVILPLIRLCNLILLGTKDDALSILDTIILDIFTTISFHPGDIKKGPFKKKQ